METSTFEELILNTLHSQPPTPRNPARETAERLMYTGETPEAFYARRAPLEALWNGFMAASRQQSATEATA